MLNILDKFCHDEVNKNGLMLLPMPTGFGKTHNVLKWITENYDKVEGKIFFTTTLKKNLPYDELKAMFIKSGKTEKWVEENVLKIDANTDCLIDNLTNIEKEIPEEFTKIDCFRKIKERIKTIESCAAGITKSSSQEDKVENLAAIAQSAKDDLMKNYEGKFRAYISKKLKSLNLKKSELLYKLKTDKELIWIGKLYPAVFTSERKIILLSIDKFLLRNDTLIEPSYQFSSSIINKSVVFIDEFDATKDTVLKRHIDEGLKGKIDYLDLFSAIDAGLSTKEFTKGLLTISEKLEELRNEGKKMQTPEQIISFLKEKVKEVKERFNLSFHHKIDARDNMGDNCFMFHDFQMSQILKDAEKEISISCDKVSTTNWIRLRNRDVTRNNSLGIVELLQSIKGCITLFQRGIRWMAENYIGSKKDQGFAEYGFEFALKTVLEEFRIQGKHRDWIIANCLIEHRETNQFKGVNSIDLTVYEKGFRYYHFLDSEEHDTLSKIQLVAFNNTPEKWMLKLASRAKVVGISATATLETVTGNYDIGYLKRKLGEKFVQVDKSHPDYNELWSSFNESIKGYINGDVQVQAVEVDNNIIENKTVLARVARKDDIEVWLNKLKASTDSVFNQNRYLKVFFVLKQFHENQDLKSLLCMLQKMPWAKDADFDKRVIDEYVDYLNRSFPMQSKTEVRVLYGQNEVFSGRKLDMLGELAKGKKLAVFSSYMTVGAGQNLQYKIPAAEKSDMVRVNSHAYGQDEKDFDAIYIDRPTHIAVNISDPAVNEESIMKYLFQVEFLQQSGEISTSQAWHKIKYAFSRLGGYKITGDPKISDTISISNHAIRVVVQAVGRICRTCNKRNTVFIFFDKSLVEIIADAKRSFKSILLNPEFQKILEHCVASSTTVEGGDKRLQEYKNRAELVSRSSYGYIEGLRKYEWSKSRMDQWKELREHVLKNPYIVSDTQNVPDIYVALPEPKIGYRYKEENDYGRVQISFVPNNSFTKHVSAEDARLSDLFMIPGLRDYFVEKGYAVVDDGRFPESTYLLTPPMFNNIYKGALGEVVGEYILKDFAHIELKEIVNEQHFELFDFCTDSGVFVDFKHWRDKKEISGQEMRDKIIGKLNQCGGKRALVINILSDEDSVHNVYVQPGIGERVVEIPYLVNSKTGEVDKNMIAKVKEWTNR